MTALEQFKEMLPTLTIREKAELLQWLNLDLANHPGIEFTPDVCGGVARIVRTRIPVWLLENATRLGSSDADLLAAYPSLRAMDLVQARAYARSNRAEIEEQIRLNETSEEES